MDKQVDKTHYIWKKYVDIPRWISYWHQISEVTSLTPSSVLIIGAGDNIVRDVLQKTVPIVKVADIDSELEPDFVGSVTDLSSLIPSKFDVVLCSQVLEHLPFEMFEKSISEIYAVTNRYLVLSVPQKYYRFEFVVTAFSKKMVKKIVTFCIEKKHKKFIAPNIDGHYWEVGVKGRSKEKVRDVLEKYFSINKEFIVPENPYHRFYILEKR